MPGRHHLSQPCAKGGVECGGVQRHAHVREHADAMPHERVGIVERRGPDAVVGDARFANYTQPMAQPTEARRGPEPPDLSEKGGMKDGQPQRSDDAAVHAVPRVRRLRRRTAARRRAGARRRRRRAVRGRQRSARRRAADVRARIPTSSSIGCGPLLNGPAFRR